MPKSSNNRVCLFSGLSDVQLSYEGKPAVGAKVIRKLMWKDHDGVEAVFFADENGIVTIPPAWDDSLILSPFVQLVISQELFVSYGEENDLEIWIHSKRKGDRFWEFDGKEPTNIRCELTEEPRRVPTDSGELRIIGTSCYWDYI